MSVAQPADRRALYGRFARHNRAIGILRLAVPLAGLAILIYPMVELAVSSLARSISIGGVRLEADTLVIDAPRFEGRTATGTVYSMTAERAESRVGDLDIADLYGLVIDIEGGENYLANASFPTAQWTMSAEHLVSNEDVTVTDSTGASGRLAGLSVDWPAQTIASDGPVIFDFDDGSRLDAETMVHDMGRAHWQFSAVRLTMTPVPDAGRERDPHAPGEP
ncbi:hypothetical protein [Pelagibacterium montanilacus]|uniref:hypothetical protein n=1 Tax=Pelagibacterium montanilacus TaxID=2185280 RepID=UPI000F8EBB27|nr:hypothetical protein [Pelagibacterium montanilacus]